VAEIVRRVQNSPFWPTTAIIITYDEFGGSWDHVAPPVVDRWGPGPRIPTVVVSPWAKKGYVDHTQYDTTSILRLIELRWGLEHIGARDATPLINAFDENAPATVPQRSTT
jgi:phospholipase C